MFKLFKQCLSVQSLLLLLSAAFLSMPSHAEDSLYIPLYTYRTGPFSNSGKPIADGISDYLNMLNARDGGIGGIKLKVEECEIGVDEWAGVECYKSGLPKKPIVITPWSSDLMRSLMPLLSKDKIPLVSMMYGISATSDGNLFPWVFNPPTTYSDSASIVVRYIASQEGGPAALKNKKIGYLYMDYHWAFEPVAVLRRLAEEYGFSLTLYPVDLFELENQSRQWKSIAADKPDYLIIYGWDTMQSVAVEHAVKNNFPMEKFISSWWLSEWDMEQSKAGEAATGVKMLNWNVTGAEHAFIADIQKHVYRGHRPRNRETTLGSLLYNHGVYNAMLIAEGIRTAQRITGKTHITGEDMRRGLESLKIDDARLEELGMKGFAYPFELSCADHNGHASAFVQRYDGKKFVRISDWIAPMTDQVNAATEPYKKKFIQDNPGWPLPKVACPAK
jgi:branched-chain amino acid transport system substrate-binding protein